MGKVTLFLLCLFAALQPFEALVYFEELPSGSKLIGMLIVGSAVLAFVTGHRVRGLSLPMVMPVVLVFYSAMSLAWSLAPEATLSNLPRIAQLLIFVLAIWEFAVTPKEQMWLLRSFLIGMLVPLAMALVTRGSMSHFDTEGEARISGGGHDLNFLAYLYTVSILIATYLATNSATVDRYCRWFYWGLTVLCGLGTVLTASRSGFVCLLLAGVFSMLLAGVGRRRIITVLQFAAAFVLVYVLVQYLVPSIALERITTKQTLEDDPRVRIWQRGLAAFVQSPILGVGSGTFGTVTKGNAARGSAPHNTFLSVGVELGLVGLALYLSYLSMIYRAAWRLPRREKLLWMGILFILLWGAMLTGSQNDKLSWLMYVLVLGQSAACTRPRPGRNVAPYPNRAMVVVRKPPPRLGKP